MAESGQIRIDILSLRKAERDLFNAIKTLEAQPIDGPLIAVMVNATSAHAVLRVVISDLDKRILISKGAPQ